MADENKQDSCNKQVSPACERNKLPLLKVLKRHFPESCRVLEVASGTGQHAEFFTSQMSNWHWQPSDGDAKALLSIEAYRLESNREQLMPAISLTTMSASWNVGKYEAALCCNMIHISPWESCLGLFRHLGEHLEPKGIFVLYGPFLQKNVATAQGNVKFDASLKSRNPSWGIRDLEDVESVAEKNAFKLIHVHEMPANNLAVVFEKIH